MKLPSYVDALIALPLQIARRKAEQWLDHDKLAHLQARRLRSVLECSKAAPYYRRALPQQAAGTSDSAILQDVPFLTKAILAAEGTDAFLTAGKSHLLSITTSGSTGQPARFFRSPAEEAEFSARWWRIYSAYGGRMHDRVLNVGRTNTRPRAGAVKWLRNLGVLPKIENVSVSDAVADSAATVVRFRPQFITGFAIGIEAIADHMVQHGLRIPPPRAVICGAMDVTAQCRRLVKRAFQARAVNVYATNEFGVIAWECPAQEGALHINEDMFLLEIVDGERPVPEGTPGEVVLTSLTLRRMPLIRFRTGDIASRIPGRCACGRGLALISPVHGRTAHAIQVTAGRLLTAPLLASAFGAAGADEWAFRYQIQQKPGGVLQVIVVPRRAPDEQQRQRLLLELRSVTGPDFHPELELTDALPLAPNGKFQYVIPLQDAR